MTTDLFVQDTALSPVADSLVPCLCQVLEAAGHSTLWCLGDRALVVDSPLEGHLVQCEAGGDLRSGTEQFLTLLQKRIHMAGGIVTEKGHVRSELRLRICTGPCDPDDRPRVVLRGRPRGFFARKAALAEVVGARLRSTLRVPVGVTYVPTMKRQELDVDLWAAEEAYPAIATALWLGLMTFFRAGPPIQVPAQPPAFLAREQRAGALLAGWWEPEPMPPATGTQFYQPPVQAPPSTPPELPAAPVVPPEPQPTPGAPPGTGATEAQTQGSPGPVSVADTPPLVSQSPTQGGQVQAHPLMQKVPYHEPLPGAVIWSSGAANQPSSGSGWNIISPAPSTTVPGGMLGRSTTQPGGAPAPASPPLPQGPT